MNCRSNGKHQERAETVLVMIIDQFNTLLTGGAAVAALRLHRGLLRSGVDSTLWHGQPAAQRSEPGLRTPWPQLSASVWDGVRRGCDEAWRAVMLRMEREYYRRGPRRRKGGFLPVRTARQTPWLPSVFKGDVIHLHWISRLVDHESFFATVPERIPVVWTLHDMTPLTGGCGHAEDCIGYTDACGDCPLLARGGSTDLSFKQLAIKRRAIAGARLHVVTPSRWMADNVRRSSLMRHVELDVIRNPIDMHHFSPLDKQEARRALGVPPDAPCVLHVAHSLNSKPKGIDEFLGTLARLRDIPGLLGLACGRGAIDSTSVGVPVRALGYLHDAEQLRLAYSAADVFVMPSHVENLPQTIVEALACGTPTVAFSVGGIPELVQEGQTGFLVPPRNVDQMANRVRWLLDHPEERQRMGHAGTTLIHRDYDSEKAVREYIALYERLTGRP